MGRTGGRCGLSIVRGSMGSWGMARQSTYRQINRVVMLNSKLHFKPMLALGTLIHFHSFQQLDRQGSDNCASELTWGWQASDETGQRGAGLQGMDVVHEQDRVAFAGCPAVHSNIGAELRMSHTAASLPQSAARTAAMLSFTNARRVGKRAHRTCALRFRVVVSMSHAGCASCCAKYSASSRMVKPAAGLCRNGCTNSGTAARSRCMLWVDASRARRPGRMASGSRRGACVTCIAESGAAVQTALEPSAWETMTGPAVEEVPGART